jgi:hypothetical protein
VGDLEEAIREHLELKRRRGADAAEVAREEQEALAPVTRSHPIVVAEAPIEMRPLDHAESPGNGSAVVRRQRGLDDGHDHRGEEFDEGPDAELPDDSTQEFRVDWLDDDDA